MSPEAKQTAKAITFIVGLAIIALAALELSALYLGRDGIMFSLIVVSIMTLAAGFAGISLGRFWDTLFGGRR